MISRLIKVLIKSISDKDPQFHIREGKVLVAYKGEVTEAGLNFDHPINACTHPDCDYPNCNCAKVNIP